MNIKKELKELIIMTIIIFILIMLVKSIMDYMDIPYVYISNSTGKCVQVTSDKYTCDNKPDKYEVIYVR